MAKFVFAAIALGRISTPRRAHLHCSGYLPSVLSFPSDSVYRVAWGGSGSLCVEQSRGQDAVSYCFPLAISKLVGVVAPRSDIPDLGLLGECTRGRYLSCSLSNGGHYGTGTGAFDTGLAPIMSRAWSQQDRVRMRDSYQAVSTSFDLWLRCRFFVVLILFANEILRVFGSEFTRGSAALMVLALGQVFNNATGSANTVLLMSGHSRLVMTTTVVMGVVLLAATATVIPFWGITGAAIAASTTFILTNVIRVIQVWRLYQVQPYTWDLMKPITAAIVAAGIIFMLHMSAVSLPSPVLGLALGMLYLSGLLLLGINQQDRLVFQSIFLRFRRFF